MTGAVIILTLIVLAPIIIGASIKIQQSIRERETIDTKLIKLKRERDALPEDDPQKGILVYYIAELEFAKQKQLEKEVKELTGR